MIHRSSGQKRKFPYDDFPERKVKKPRTYLDKLVSEEKMSAYEAYSMYQNFRGEPPKNPPEVLQFLRKHNRTTPFHSLKKLFEELEQDARGLKYYAQIKACGSKEDRMRMVFEERRRQKARRTQMFRAQKAVSENKRYSGMLSRSTGLLLGKFKIGEKRFQSFVVKDRIETRSPPLKAIELGSVPPQEQRPRAPKPISQQRRFTSATIPTRSLTSSMRKTRLSRHQRRLTNTTSIAVNERARTIAMVGSRGPGFTVKQNSRGEMVVGNVDDARCPFAGLRVGTVIKRFNGKSDFSAEDVSNARGSVEVEFVTDLFHLKDDKNCAQKIGGVVMNIIGSAGRALPLNQIATFVTNGLESVFHEPRNDSSDAAEIAAAMKSLGLDGNKKDDLRNELDEIERRQLEEEERLKLEREKISDPIVAARLKPLTVEEEDEVDELMSAYGDEVIASQFNQTITARHIESLRPGEWLNDEVMNFYFNMIMDRSKTQSAGGKNDTLRCWCFNTFFLEKLTKGYTSYNYPSVRRWTKSKKMKRLTGVSSIFECDLCFIPCHVSEMHWTCGVIDIKNKRLEYFDSMSSSRNGDGRQFIQTMKRYLIDEANNKLKQDIETDDWEEHIPNDIPCQRNGFDCGMFSCLAANFRSEDRRFEFSQENMPDLRRRMVLQIKNKDVDYHVH